MRISINRHHQEFILQLAQQMGTTPKNALDFILWELRKSGYSFSAKLNLTTPTGQAETQTQPLLHFGNAFPTDEQPEINDVVLNEQFEPIDPVIQRFLDLGVDDF